MVGAEGVEQIKMEGSNGDIISTAAAHQWSVKHLASASLIIILHAPRTDLLEIITVGVNERSLMEIPLRDGGGPAP